MPSRPEAAAASRADKRPGSHAGTLHDAANAEAQVKVLQQFRIVFNAVKTHFQQVERQAGVGGAQVWALSIIRDRPGIGVNGLAAALNVRQPTASNLVRNLALQSMIDVRREGSDRRAVQLHATTAGRRMLKRSPGPFAGVLPQALAALDAQALLRLETDLAALIRLLDADESAATIPLAQL
jgi:DNA-binding MarR family transcriptional regulator